MWEISDCLFLDQDLHCVTLQTDQTAPTCETDDLSLSPEGQRKGEELIIYSLLISHHEFNNDMSFWIARNSDAVFQLRLSLSVGLTCHEASSVLKGKLILRSHVSASSFA